MQTLTINANVITGKTVVADHVVADKYYRNLDFLDKSAFERAVYRSPQSAMQAFIPVGADVSNIQRDETAKTWVVTWKGLERAVLHDVVVGAGIRQDNGAMYE